ncbi:MAG: DNA repair protein RadC [Bacillota bacterium]
MKRKGLKIQELPPRERPRERLLQWGAGDLTNAEILALLMGTGNPQGGENVLDLAQRVLVSLGRRGGSDAVLRNLLDTSVEELCDISGIGRAKASAIVAAVELGRRVAAEMPRSSEVNGPQDVARILVEDMRYLDRECFKIVLLNTRNRVLGIEVVSVGGLDSSVVHPREIFKVCVRRSAAAVILAHNHPSGDPTPSREDIEVTERIVSAGTLMGIDVLDHLIIGDDCYVSLREQGGIWDMQS